MLFLFDCDGVLVDSEIIAAEVDAKLFTELGVPLTAEDIVRRYAGLTLRKIIEMIEKDTGRQMPEDLFERHRTILEERLARDLKAVAGLDDILHQLDGGRCICSNSSSARMRLTLGKTNLYDAFAPHIYSAIEVGDRQPKPSPNVFLHAAEQFDRRGGVLIQRDGPVRGLLRPGKRLRAFPFENVGSVVGSAKRDMGVGIVGVDRYGPLCQPPRVHCRWE